MLAGAGREGVVVLFALQLFGMMQGCHKEYTHKRYATHDLTPAQTVARDEIGGGFPFGLIGGFFDLGFDR